jgi:hypothetical protein
MRPLFAQQRVARSAENFLDGLLGEERCKADWMRPKRPAIQETVAVGSARNDHRKTGENRRTSLGDRRQFRNDEERTRPRSQRDALLAWLASSRVAGHARLRHDGGDPRSRQQSRAAPKNNAPQSQDAPSISELTNPSLIRWSMQEIRRIATRLARKRIRPDFVIAWSLWRRAHQAQAKRAHIKSQL